MRKIYLPEMVKFVPENLFGCPGKVRSHLDSSVVKGGEAPHVNLRHPPHNKPHCECSRRIWSEKCPVATGMKEFSLRMGNALSNNTITPTGVSTLWLRCTPLPSSSFKGSRGMAAFQSRTLDGQLAGPPPPRPSRSASPKPARTRHSFHCQFARTWSAPKPHPRGGESPSCVAVPPAWHLHAPPTLSLTFCLPQPRGGDHGWFQG